MFDSIKSMADSDPGPHDLIAATTLNVTKFGALLVTITTAAVGAIDALDISVLGGKVELTAGQWVLAMFGAASLVVVLMVADMVVRAYVTAHAAVRAAVLQQAPEVNVYRHGEVHAKGHEATPADGVAEAFMIDETGVARVLVRRTDRSEWLALEDVDVKV